MRWDVMENAHHFLPFCHSLMCSYALFGCFCLISSLLGCWKHVLIIFWCLVLSGWLTPVCMNGGFCFVSDFRCELFAITWGRSHCDMSVEMCCLWCIYMQKMTICLVWSQLDSVCMWWKVMFSLFFPFFFCFWCSLTTDFRLYLGQLGSELTRVSISGSPEWSVKPVCRCWCCGY